MKRHIANKFDEQFKVLYTKNKDVVIQQVLYENLTVGFFLTLKWNALC